MLEVVGRLSVMSRLGEGSEKRGWTRSKEGKKSGAWGVKRMTWERGEMAWCLRTSSYCSVYLRVSFTPDYCTSKSLNIINLCYTSFLFEQAFTYTIGIYIQNFWRLWARRAQHNQNRSTKQQNQKDPIAQSLTRTITTCPICRLKKLELQILVGVLEALVPIPIPLPLPSPSRN